MVLGASDFRGRPLPHLGCEPEVFSSLILDGPGFSFFHGRPLPRLTELQSGPTLEGSKLN